MKLIEDLGVVPTNSGKERRQHGIYECEICKKHFKVLTKLVNYNKQTRCVECGNITHGLSKHPLYPRWVSIKERCYNHKAPEYHRYGVRGITLSEDFHNFKVFYDYVTSLPNYKKEGYTLDRINNDKGYERGNLRWADPSLQSINQRKRKDNTSGYVGIRKHNATGKWAAQLEYKNEVLLSKATYPTKKEALAARNKYILENNLPHKIQEYKGENYGKTN